MSGPNPAASPVQNTTSTIPPSKPSTETSPRNADSTHFSTKITNPPNVTTAPNPKRAGESDVKSIEPKESSESAEAAAQKEKPEQPNAKAPTKRKNSPRAVQRAKVKAEKRGKKRGKTLKGGEDICGASAGRTSPEGRETARKQQENGRENASDMVEENPEDTTEKAEIQLAPEEEEVQGQVALEGKEKSFVVAKSEENGGGEREGDEKTEVDASFPERIAEKDVYGPEEIVKARGAIDNSQAVKEAMEQKSAGQFEIEEETSKGNADQEAAALKDRFERLRTKCAESVSVLTGDLEKVVNELLWTKEQLVQGKEQNQQLAWKVAALQDELDHANKELRKVTLNYQAALCDKGRELENNQQLHVFLGKYKLDNIEQAEGLLDVTLREKAEALEHVRHLSSEVKVEVSQRHIIEKENNDIRKEVARYKQQCLKQQMELELVATEGKRKSQRISSLQHQLQISRRQGAPQAPCTQPHQQLQPHLYRGAKHQKPTRIHPIGGGTVEVQRPSNQKHALRRLHKRLQRFQGPSSFRRHNRGC